MIKSHVAENEKTHKLTGVRHAVLFIQVQRLKQQALYVLE